MLLIPACGQRFELRVGRWGSRPLAAHDARALGARRRGEADLRVNGKKMELTSIPSNEWSQVVKDASGFWDEVAQQSSRSAKVVEAFKLYAATMDKAGYPYR